MQPVPVIEHLDEFKHRRLRLVTRVEHMVVHELVLQGAEEALDDRVVITVPPFRLILASMPWWARRRWYAVLVYSAP